MNKQTIISLNRNITALKQQGHNGPTTYRSAEETPGCLSAISPLAYLADLLDYATRHILKQGTPISLEEIEAYFHQPFGRIPLNCEALQEEVPQIRICVEVLRQHFKEGDDYGLPNSTEKQYREDTYATLLLKLGTSVSVIKNIADADADTRAKVADTLAIDEAHLNKLWPGQDKVSEDWLSRIFGVARTTEVQFDNTIPEFLAWREERLAKTADSLFGSNADNAGEQEQWLTEKKQATAIQLRQIGQATEELMLPILRKAYLPSSESARQAGNQLLINCEYDACFRTTRVSQAITTVQQLIASVRTGLLLDTHPELTFEADGFMEEWKWLGSYQSWRSAMMVFLFPENVLNPGLYENYSPAIRKVFDHLRKQRSLSAADVEKAMESYETYLKDISDLDVEASCQTFYTEDPETSILFQFGRSSNGKVYMSTFSNNHQQYWSAAPEISKKESPDDQGNVFQHHTVKSILAAAPFQMSTGQRVICLVLEYHRTHVQTGNHSGKKLYLLLYDLDEKTWKKDPVGLHQPSKFYREAVVARSNSEVSGIRLYLTIGDAVHNNLLNADLSGFENKEWLQAKLSGVLVDAIERPHKSGWLFVNKSSHTEILDSQSNSHGGWDIWPLNLTYADHSTVGVVFGTQANVPFIHWLVKMKTGYIWSLDISAGSFGVKRPLGSQMVAFSKHFGTSIENNFDGFRLCYAYSNQGKTIQQHTHFSENQSVFRFQNTRSTTFSLEATFSLKPSLAVDRKSETNKALSNVSKSDLHLRDLLWEAYFFLPLYAGSLLQRAGRYTDAKDYYRLIYDYAMPNGERKVFYGLIQEESHPEAPERHNNWLSDPLNPHAIAAGRQNAYTQYCILSIVQGFLQEADGAFARDTIEDLGTARTLYTTVLTLLKDFNIAAESVEAASLLRSSKVARTMEEVLQAPDRKLEAFNLSTNLLLNVNSFTFSVPDNPVWQMYRMHAEINLFKINTCRNIAGEERPMDAISVAMTNLEDLFYLQNGQLNQAPRPRSLRPTPYRYTLLIDRAKQLANLAQQIEASFLTTLEKLDAETLNVINAQNEIQLSKAGIRLQDLRLNEADHGVKLVGLQTDRTEIQVNHYTKLIAEGFSGYERAALKAMGWKPSNPMAALNNRIGEFVHEFTGGLAEYIPVVGGFFGSSNARKIQRNTTLASYERRAQEWEHQLNLSQQDILIGQQQRRIAEDQVKVVTQERQIATLRSNHAETVAQFLTNKFTNAELYDWMSEVLEGIYSFFLQQATATAQLAAQQLAFERQEPVPTIILADYWEAPRDNITSGESSDKAPDRRGLTGSARLQQDIHQLDQFALQTDRRKLQMSKTISLASLLPAEFQQFRETGNLFFHTPMELFDRDFPGHHLRLIERVRVSVIALAPTIEGIKATLSSSGVSRTVQAVNGAIFSTTEIKRLPESIALTGAINATGIFDFEAADQTKLRPFESMGVDATWQFELPKAANLSLNYDTIADVLITIDYTALHSEIHKMEVIERLDKTLVADRAFSFRNDFLDQWYDLHHPEDLPAEQQLTAHFDLLRDDFPPNIQNLRVKHITLHLPQEDYPSLAVTLNREGKSYPYQNRMTPEGIASSRDADNHPERWQKMLGKSPVGPWTLGFPVNDTVKQWFKGGRFQDIILVITYEGDIQY